MTVDVEDIQSNNSLLVANYTVSPGPELLDPVTHALKEDLSFVVTSAVTASNRTWSKGTLPDVFRVSLPLTGDVADWPFDRYQSGPITAHLLSGAARETTVIHTVIMVDRLLGWKINVAHGDESDAPGAYRVDLYRSSSAVALGAVILGVLVALAGVGLFVCGSYVAGPTKIPAADDDVVRRDALCRDATAKCASRPASLWKLD